MSESSKVEVKDPITGDGQGTPPDIKPADEKSEEVKQLEAKKAELEEQVRGLEGTVVSLKEDIVRKREERKVDSEEQQPPIDKEALLAELDSKIEERIQPILKENEILRKAVLKSNEEALKAKKQALENLNARIASVATPSASAVDRSSAEPKVELTADEKEIAKIVGLKNPRYMKETEVL